MASVNFFALCDVPGWPGSRRRQPRVRDHRSPARAGPRAPCPRTRVCTIAVSKVIHLRLHGSPWSAFHGGHRPGRCRQPGEPGFPPACASAAVTGCNWGCSTLSPPPAGAQQGVTGRFIRTGPGRGHAHRPFGPSPASVAGSVAAAPAAPAVAAGKGRAPASPRANRSRSTAAVRTRPGPGPSGPPRRPPEWPAGRHQAVTRRALLLDVKQALVDEFVDAQGA